jgi:hypothetical protein
MNNLNPRVNYQPLACFASEHWETETEGPIQFKSLSALGKKTDPQSHLLGCFEDPDGHPRWLSLLQQHPDGQHVALQANVWIRCATTRAGVWDVASGKLVWEPQDTLALCWNQDGDEIYLVRDSYQRSPDHPDRIIGPAQHETTYFFERWAWCDPVMTGRCTIRPPTGWLDYVTVSPRGNLAAIRWIEQDCAGIVLVVLLGDGVQQLPAAQFRTEWNHVSRPIFSPNGRYLVLTSGSPLYEDEEDEESEVFRCHLGFVWIYNTATDNARAVAIEEEWHTIRETNARLGYLGEPRFVSADEFVVRLPTGAQRRYRCSEDRGQLIFGQ